MARHVFDRRLSRSPAPVHGGFWRLRIGPIPVSWEDDAHDAEFTTVPHTAPPPEITNALIQKYNCPGLSIKYAPEGHYKFVTNIPIQEDNEYEKTFQVTMLCDNWYENWWAFHRYMDTVMSGRTGGFPEQDPEHRIYGLDRTYRNRLTFIPYIEMHAADDCAQEHMIVRFERCRLTDLGDLQPQLRGVDPLPFSITVKYEIKRIIRLPDPNNLMSAICVSTSNNSYTTGTTG